MMWQLLHKLNKRAIIFLAIAMVILMVIIVDRFSFSPFSDTTKNTDDVLSLKKDLFVKYNTAISMKDSYRNELDKLKNAYHSIENMLFQCKTEDLAQAKLREYVSNIARQSGLIISRSSAQKGETISEQPHLMLVYAKVDIADIDKIRKLQKFLYKIEHEREKLIFIDDLKVKGSGFDVTKGVSATINLLAIAKLETKT